MLRVCALSMVGYAALSAATPQPQPFQRPLVFEPNRGQASSDVKWIARASGYQLLLTSRGVTMLVPDRPADASRAAQLLPTLFQPREEARPATAYRSVEMHLPGSHDWTSITGLEPTGGVSNYFLGDDPKQWRANVPHYARLNIGGVYDGIDLVLYSKGTDLEYDFVVKPGADPKQIRLAFDGMDRMNVERAGNLLLTTEGGSEIRHLSPKVYQQWDGRKVEVAAAYELLSSRQAGFALAPYDRARDLVIDPTVSFTTFLAGSGADAAYGIAVDGAGNSYVAGWTVSSNFPLVSNLRNYSGSSDAFVTKLNAAGSIVFSTYWGGEAADSASGIAVDGTGIYITGDTLSSAWPGSRNLPVNGQSDMFVTKFNLAGNTWLYSFALGGTSYDSGKSIAVDSAQNAYVTGYTYSRDFPMYGSWHMNFAGNVDAFIMKVNPAGTPINSTFLGGESTDFGYGIAVDASSYPWVTGMTCSTSFPHTMPITIGAGCNTFVTRLNNSFTGMLFSTEMGGGNDWGTAITVDKNYFGYVTGVTYSGFPTTPGVFQTAKLSSGGAAFVMKLDSLGGTYASTYLGGRDGTTTGAAITVDGNGNVWVSGSTSSTAFPGVQPLKPNPTAGFVSKFKPNFTGLEYSQLLGAAVNGVKIYQSAIVFRPTQVYTAGYRYTGGTSYQNMDAFVVKLTEDSIIIAQ